MSSAGETGHLVLSTVHTTDVTSTVARVSDAFPPERQATIRQELSLALAAVMTQMLLPGTVTEAGPEVHWSALWPAGIVHQRGGAGSPPGVS